MGSDWPNSENKPPNSTFLRQENHDELTIGLNEAADCSVIFSNNNSLGADRMCFPYMSLPAAPNHQPCTLNIPETGGRLMDDCMMVNSLQDFPVVPNSINTRHNLPRFVGVPEISLPLEYIRGMHQPLDHDNMVTSDNAIVGGCHLGSFRTPQMNRKFMPTSSNVAGVYQMSRQGGETRGGHTNRLHINENFVDLGFSPPMNRTHNTGEIETANNAKVRAVQFGCPEEIDGSFLTLGIGDTEGRSKPKFDSQEIASKLQEAVSPQLHSSQSRETTRIVGNAEAIIKSKFDRRPVASKLEEAGSTQFSTSHVQQTTRDSSMVHNLAGGFSSPVCTVDGWTASHDNVGVIRGANHVLSSTSLHILQSPQADVQNNFLMPSNRNLGFAGTKDARIADLDPYKISRGDQAPSSLPFSSTSAGFLRLGQTEFCGLASEAANPPWINTQPTSNQLQDCYNKAVNYLSEPSMNLSSLRNRESSFRQDNTGRLFSAPDFSVVQPAGGSQVPKRIEIKVTESSAAQSGANGPFPKRLGVHLNESGAAQIAEGCPFPWARGPEAMRNIRRPLGSGPVQFNKNLLRPPFAIGRLQDCVPAQSSIDLRAPSSTTGHSQVAVPGQFSKDLLRHVSTTGQGIQIANIDGLSQASDVLGVPSLKRGAIQRPPAARWVQRRKIMPQPTSHPSMPYPPQIASAPIPIPAHVPALFHIKWQGFDGTPQPNGDKCLICKRDLSFTPDGPVYQPAVAPAVAVLPCGHTFHDHCLQNITPEDQSKNPPCIPCAIDET